MSWWDLGFYLIIAAAVYMLVRPGSPAGAAVVALTDLTAGLVGTATGAVFTKGA